METFKIPATGLTLGTDKLRDGYVIVGSYPIDEHNKAILKARRYEVRTAGVFVRPDSPIEVGTWSVTCGRRGCARPRCAEQEARNISSALTHVFRATGNAVMAVTVPRLANAAEFEAALWAVIDAGSVIASHDGVEGVYGLVAVPEWHLEGRNADRATEVIGKGVRASFPFHQHAAISLTLADDAPVDEIEAAFTVALRDCLNENVYRGSLKWKEAAADIAAVKAKSLKDSVPVGLLKPLGTLGNSDWYKFDYLAKNLDSRTHALYGGVAGAWGVERQRAICDALLVPGNSKRRVTPLRGVKLSNYGWFNAYAYPVGDDEHRVEHRFMSQGGTGWTRKTVEEDTTRRRKGFLVEEDRFYHPSTGWLEEVTHKGITLSEVITSTVVDANLTVTAAEALRRARVEVRARLMAECEAEYARIEANVAMLRAIKAERRTRFTRAMYAALCAVLSGLAQERAVTLQTLLRGVLASLGIEKAAHMPLGFALVLLDVQSTAKKARAPPRHTCRPPVILPSIKDIDLLISNSFNGTTKRGLTQYRNPGFRMLRRDYLGFGVPGVGKVLGIGKPPSRYVAKGFRVSAYASGVLMPSR